MELTDSRISYYSAQKWKMCPKWGTVLCKCGHSIVAESSTGSKGGQERYRNMILFHNGISSTAERPKNEPQRDLPTTLKATKELTLKVNSLRQPQLVSAI